MPDLLQKELLIFVFCSDKHLGFWLFWINVIHWRRFGWPEIEIKAHQIQNTNKDEAKIAGS